ncbi:MAG: hypothetical protein ABH854_01625 [Candidatus Diapherotrites archaeon]|nr:hypothetical protein [Candidatus Micrarchaeota archaeon]MBU1939256.1 hypothetical protein [Candidatus Micrarchaeota archaeon]
MRSAKKKEGKPLPPKPEDKVWLEEFNEMTEEDHRLKLKQLGLDDEDLEEFGEQFNGGDAGNGKGECGAGDADNAPKGAKEKAGKKK